MTTPPAATARRDARRAIVGLAVSNSGTWVQRVSLDLLLLTAGGAGALAAGVALQQLPSAILFRPAGWFADRFDRRRLLVVCDAILAVLALVPVLVIWPEGPASELPLLAFAAVSGVVLAVETTARHTMLGELVIAAGQPRLLGLSALIPNLGKMIGPAVGALIIGTAGHAEAHLVNAGSFVVAAVLVLTTTPRPREAALHDRARGGVVASVRATGTLPHVVLLWWTFLFTQGTRVYLPLLTEAESASDYGFLLTLVGVGGGIAGIAAWRHQLFATTAAGFTAGMALPVAVSGLVPQLLPMTVVGALAIGFCTSILTISTRVAINERTPERMRGRHAGVVVAAIQGSSPLSALLTSGWVGIVGATAGILSMQSVAAAGVVLIVATRLHPRGPGIATAPDVESQSRATRQPADLQAVLGSPPETN